MEIHIQHRPAQQDGCRNGDNCDFCHFCSPQAVKDCASPAFGSYHLENPWKTKTKVKLIASAQKSEEVGPW
jgi:hypothetical protein